MAQTSRSTHIEMEQEIETKTIDTASTMSTPLDAKAPPYYPASRDRDCEGVGSFQSREDSHYSDDRTRREIDFSLPTDLSGPDTASATQVTRDDPGNIDEERAIRVNTAG